MTELPMRRSLFPLSNPKTLVVLDDLRDLASLLADFAEICGWDAYAVNNKQDFESAINKHSPSLVFLDVYMPEYDGVNALGFLKELDFTGHVCFISSCSEATMKSMQDLAVGYGLNCCGSFSKPVNFKALFNLLYQID
ncbi:MAG: response regulator [Kordiimonadaceae bacterium]|nr:response regulator [Kordiimonadaceae bacterium]MBO6567512.1 response regulator [Kordiimonadaceae bacterium]MBO6963274.1 response regulator [Kordiimonadaceae bacterium]